MPEMTPYERLVAGGKRTVRLVLEMEITDSPGYQMGGHELESQIEKSLSADGLYVTRVEVQ